MSESAAATEGDQAEMVTLEIRKGPDASREVGGLRFVACRREVGTIDGGVTLYVYGAMGGDRLEHAEADWTELLRFDLFRNRPHYHAPAENQAETAIDASGDGSIAWGVEALTQRASEFVVEAGFDSIASTLDERALSAASGDIAELLGSLGSPDSISYFDVPKAVFDQIENPAA